MIKTASCPNDAALQHYSEGWADAIETRELEEHLTTCEKCEQRLSELETARASDGLIEALRLRGQIPTQAMTTGNTPSSSPVAVDDLEADAELQQVLAEIREWPLSAVASPDAEVPLPKSVGQYELLERIGQGGMAHVYRARHSKLQRTVAVKLLNVPKWQVDRSLARLEREIAVVGQLHHPAIVAATDAGQHDGTPYLVTEFIDGLNLSQLARAVPADAQLKTADACEAIRVAALGLAHAHSQGVTHRDIKPSNLMIDRQGNVKILDFGLVHLEGWQDENLELTTVGQLLGTLDYMAPEQADKATAVDHRSDVYALGATLFRLLCGRAPYAASLYQSPLEKLRLLALTEPPKVETLRPDVPRELAALVDQTLERDPARRPPSAAHVAEALVPFCAGAELGAWVQRAIANPPLPLPTAARGLATPLSSMIDSADQTKQVPATQPAGRGRSTWPWWIAAAAGAAAMWMGILFILDEQKGQLVIESESADVRVTLRRDGQASATLQLQPGLNQTRVFAGTYEIEIDGPADAFQMDRDTIVIKRGEVVLARVSRRAVAGSDMAAPASTVASPGNGLGVGVVLDPPRVDQATYKGLPFSHWATVFRNERDAELRFEAFTNLSRFHSSETYIQQSRELLVEAILESHRTTSPGMEKILDVQREVYRLNRAQMLRIADSIEQVEPAEQANMIASLQKLTRSYPLTDDLQSLHEGLLAYFEMISRIAAKSHDRWTPEGKIEIWNAIVLAVQSVEGWLKYRPTANSKLVGEARSLAKDCLAKCKFDLSELYPWIERNHIEERPFARELVIEALLSAIPNQPSLDLETAKLLTVIQRLAPHLTDIQRRYLRSRLEDWLKKLTIAELSHPIAETSRQFMQISVRSDGSFSYHAGDEEDAFNPSNRLRSLVRFGSEPERINTTNQLVALQNWVLRGSVTRTAAAEDEFQLLIGTPPMLGELLISTWVLLHEGKSDHHGPLIEKLVADTRSAFDTFSQFVLEHQRVFPSVNQAIIDSNGVRAFAPPARRRGTFRDLNALEIANVVDEVWAKLGLNPEQSIAAATFRGVKVTNPKWMGEYNKPSELDINIVESSDLDKDGQVTKDELFSYLSQCDPLQKIEGVSAVTARTMLLHHFLLLLLGRPVPDLKLDALPDNGSSDGPR